jgi:hypothetical protein
VIEGDIEIDATDLEDTVVDAAQATRFGGAILPLADSYEADATGFVFRNGGLRAVPIDGPNDGTMRLGPSAFGSIVLIRFDPDRTPVGPSLAPRTIATFEFAAELWGLEIPALEPAPNLC